MFKSLNITVFYKVNTFSFTFYSSLNHYPFLIPVLQFVTEGVGFRQALNAVSYTLDLLDSRQALIAVPYCRQALIAVP